MRVQKVMRSPEGGLAPAVLFRPQLLTGSQISDRFRSRDCAVEKWDWQDVKAEEGSRPPAVRAARSLRGQAHLPDWSHGWRDARDPANR